jgi:hypothetical protein
LMQQQPRQFSNNFLTYSQFILCWHCGIQEDHKLAVLRLFANFLCTMMSTLVAALGHGGNPMSNIREEQSQTLENAGRIIFQAVVEEDYECLARTFATNARNSLVSYMSMKSRWARQQESMAKSGKKTMLRRDET